MKTRQHQSKTSTQAQRIHAILVVAVSIGLRALVAYHALSAFGAPWFFARGNEMGYVAASLLKGHGFASPFGYETGPTAIIAPAYPLLVAGIFRLLGVYSLRSACVLISINILLNALCAWMILTFARLVATEKAAVFSALFWAISPPLLWLPTIFWESNFSCVLLVGLLLVVCTNRKSGKSIPWALLGIWFAAASLVNPALMPTLACVLVVTHVTSRYAAKKIVLSFAVAAVLYAAWPVRNWIALHAWVPTRTTIGLELWMGNHEGSDGTLQQSLFPTYNQKEQASYLRLGEVAYMRSKEQAALGYIRSNPLHCLRLSGRRTLRFWFGAGNLHGSRWYQVDATVTTIMGLLGLCALLRSREAKFGVVLLLPLLLFPLPYYLTHAEFRYRILLDPVLAVAGARGMDRIRDAFYKCKKRRFSEPDGTVHFVA